LIRRPRAFHPGRAAALCLALLALGFFVPVRAFAHAELVFSDPAANSVLPESPPQMSMVFSEAIDAPSATVTLLDTGQRVIPGVSAVTVDAAGTTATISLPTLTPGTYTVSYQVTSAVDGHVGSGIFAFGIDPTGTAPPPNVTSSSTSLSSGLDVVAARWLALAAALSLAGMVIFWLFSARPALAASGTREVAAPWGPISVAAAISLLGLAVYLTLASRPIVASGGHLGHGSSLPLDFAAPFGWTPFAISMRVALLGALAAFVLAVSHWIAHNEARRGQREAPLRADRGWLGVMVGAAAVLLGGMSFAGHAAAEGGPLMGAIDLVHMLGVATWIGTLVGLFLLVRRARPAVPGALKRHSRVAIVAAPVVVLTGLANSPLLLGNPRELVASEYGNLLLSKAFLFCAAVGIGAVNYFLVRLGRSRRALPLIGIELAVGTLAVLAAAGLVSGQPSVNRQPGPAQNAVGTLHLYGEAGQSSVHAAIDLPAPGNQRYQVGVADLDTGQPRTDVQRVFMVFTPPADSGLTVERVQLNEGDDPGLFGATGVYTPVVGDWQLEVIVRRVGLRDASSSFSVPVAEPRPPESVPPSDTGVGVSPIVTTIWGWLPAGLGSWLLVLALLAVAVVLSLLARRQPARILALSRVAVVALAVALGLAAGSHALVQAANQAPAAEAAKPNPVQADERSLSIGESYYLANCAACHGIDGLGDGPTAQRLGWTLTPLDQELPQLSDGALSYRIAVGTVGTGMPGFASTLAERDRWDLVNYLRDRFDDSAP
jgi:copper transport protein